MDMKELKDIALELMDALAAKKLGEVELELDDAKIKIKAAETVDELLIEGSEQMCFTMGDEAMKAFKRKKQPPLTRMAAMDMLREALDGARDYGAKPADERKPDKKMDALLPVVNGEMTARFECLRADDIVAAV